MIDQQKIKNVILDLGGVLVDIEPQNTFSAFKRIMHPEYFEDMDQVGTEPEIILEMEVGNLKKEEFYNHFKKICRPGIIEEEIVDAWNAMIMEFPHERLELVRLLNKKYNLYLLSNTNYFHINCFETDFRNRYNFPMKSLFKNVYYSSEIGFRKPNSECFSFVINHSGINVSETVMVDDREDNCLAAESAGMMSLKVPDNTGLEAVIGELL